MSKFILVVATFYCTNVLTKAEFGEFSFIRNTMTMILTICATNFSSLCTKFATEAKTSIASVQRLFLLFLFSLLMCVIAGVLLELLPEQTIFNILGGKCSIDYFRVCGLLMPVFMLHPLAEGVLRGMMKFRLIGYIQVGTSLLYVAVIAIGIEWGGAYGAIMALYLYYVVYSLVCLYFLLKGINIHSIWGSVHGFISQSSSLYKMILPVFILSFVEAPVFWFLQTLLARHASMEAVASMTVMKQLRNFAVLIPTYFFSTFFAFAGNMNAEKRYREYFIKFDYFLKLFGLIGIGVALLIAACGKWILWLYSPEYISDWLVLCISVICIPLGMLITLVKVELIIQEHQRYLMFVSIIISLIWVGGYIVLHKLGFTPLMSFFMAEIMSLITCYVLNYFKYKQDKDILLS